MRRADQRKQYRDRGNLRRRLQFEQPVLCYHGPDAWHEAERVLGPAAGANTAIHFAIGECSLGSILVARSGKGICAILLGDDPESLARELRTASRAGADRRRCRVRGMVAMVVGSLNPRSAARPSVDVRGTAFQERVWQALRAIPPGRTATYAEIARAVGRPKAVRAVAQSLRRQSAGGRDPLPPGGADGRRPLRLPLGRRAQAGASGAGGGVIEVQALAPTLSHRERARGVAPLLPPGEGGRRSRPDEGAAAIDALDWPALRT